MDLAFLKPGRNLISSPFADNVDRFLRSQELGSKKYVDELEVDCRFFCEFNFDPIWAAACILSSQPLVESVYLGMTNNVPWRWKFCDGYRKMVCHQRVYDKMYPLA